MPSTLEQHVDISGLTGYRLPAKARYFFVYNGDNMAQLRQALVEFQSYDLPILILSGGTNMLLAFEEYPGLVIFNDAKGYTLDGTVLTVHSGHMIWEVAKDLEETYGIDLWHRFIWLPGSVGGAVYGNAGCFGLETEGNFVSCRCLDMRTGEVIEYGKDEMEFSYRFSMLKKNRHLMCLEATFDLSQKVEKYASDVDNIDFRENKQPKGLSCGSFFKNPSQEKSAGFLIEAVGLKGHKIGGAFFSDKHANFLMSDGTATHEDMLALIELAQKRVYQEFWIHLENEVQIITNQTWVRLSQT